MSELLSLRVLILEDKPSDAELMVDELRHAGFEPEWSRVDNEADYLARLDPTPDIILADYNLPQWDAPSALRVLQERGLDVPFIVVSGTIGDETAASLVRQGVADYLLKDRLARLGQAVANALEDRRLRQEKQKADATLRASETRYRRLFEAAKDGILILDSETGQIVDVNPFLIDLLGYSHEQFLGKRLWEIGTFRDVAASQDAFRRLVADGQVRYEDLPLETADGRSIAVEFVSNVYQAGGETVVQCNIRDITERKRAERELRKNEALLAQMGRVSKIGAWELNVETSELVWTEEVYRIHEVDTGYHPAVSEAISFYAPTSRPIIEQAVQRAIEFSEPYDLELEFITAKGNHRWVHTLGMPSGQSGEARTVFGTFQDITERKRAEEDLRFQAQLLNTVGQAVIATNIDGKVVFWNRFAETLYGWSAEEAMGRNVMDLTPATIAREQAAAIMTRLQSGESWSGEFEVQHRDGTTFPALVTDTPIVNEQGAQAGIIGVSIDISDRKRAEKTLEREHNLLRTVIDNLPDSIYAKDREGRFLLRNAPWLRLMGVTSLDEVIGTTDFDHFPQEMAERYNADDQQVIQSGQPLIDHEEMTIDTDGSIRWLLTTKVPLFDDRNNVTGLVGISRDITNAREADAELRKLYRAVEQSASTVVITDLQGNIEYVNPHFAQVTGYTAEEVIGQNPRILKSGETPPEVYAQLWETILAGGEWRGEFHNRRKSGDLFWELASISAIEDSDGQITSFLAVKEDITERKRAEAAIRELNADLERRVDDRTAQLDHVRQRTEAILNSSSDIIILCRTDGTIDQANWAFDRNFGWSVEEIFGQTLSSLAISEYVPVLGQEFRTVVETRQPQRLEITVRRRDGDTFAADMVLSPVLGPDGALSGIVCVLRDITARKQMEDDLRAALAKEQDLNELKMHFVSMVSHDFRTPLAVIQSSSEMLQSYHDRMDEDGRAKHFSKINSQISRMIDLLNDVLTISRVDAGKIPFTPVLLDLDRFCRGLADEFQRDPAMNLNHALVYSCSDEPMAVPIDVRVLRQALINLLTNAFKYSPEGGAVRFDLSLDEDHALIRVTDSGIGIPETDLPHLFETFYRASNVGEIPGTGLGLAIVKRAIDAHSGTITCESQVGIGTTFVVRLPTALRTD